MLKNVTGSMGGDIGGLGPPKDLMWADGPCIRPPKKISEVVLSNAFESVN